MKVEAFMEDRLLALLKHRPITQIYVSELIEEVGICKATFYKHYCDKYDLLQRCFERQFYADVLAHAETLDQFLGGCLAAFKKSPKAVLNAMLSEDPGSLFGYHAGLVKKFLLGDRKRAGKPDNDDTPYLADFYADGVTRATVAWLSAPKLTPCDEMLRRFRAALPVGL